LRYVRFNDGPLLSYTRRLGQRILRPGRQKVNPKDASCQHLLEKASFDEVQPLVDEQAVSWSAEDSGALVDLADAEDDIGGNNGFKEEF
jgi:hypothetical protein